MEDEGVGGVVEDEKKVLKVISKEEAKYWTDAFPIGNGRLGGMIWGGVTSETINLNGTYTALSTLIPISY